ncbi:putative plus-end-directed kinesin ATPase [Medicago truncatula]|uniref:Kinesin motor domain protein n=1 Tax=Medicago truncatula TaxID=3880 RepID=G7K4C8_MEDTR|nr:kinesin-like protein KIN-12F [Medicago truncatula]AET00644.1 kinesin motor domain protein [Medicago truncatula]RHN57884.1 putative plus-end-directed kinesin ATPase [Medicago truncatula]
MSSTSSIRNLLPRSFSSKRKSTSNPKFPNPDTENTPPTDPNIIQINPQKSLSITTKQSQSKPPISITPLDSDPSVKVVVRIRPTVNIGIGDETVKKVSSDTLCVGGRQFQFDSIFDTNTSQEDIFQSVGVPLVRNALAGYNTSILSYGQSGSGKTYTMWGPPSAMFEEPSPQSHKGIVPRIFQMLFSELEKEQGMSEGKQFNYQCRCCFLEIYNGQIGDLLDPTQRNLEMKVDSKNALSLENLSEEYVTSYDEVTQILIKGLSSRKVGATTLNSKSSRSHIIFTFVIESWCKGTSTNGFSSSKSSRISLIDVAGQDRNKVDGAGRHCLRETRNIKKSLSQLGHLVDALTKEPRLGKAEVPNRSSCLTRLLHESLGGNAKLSVICSIYPDNRNNSETLRTLRFGQRVRLIQNEPVINEIKEDDVNDLSDQIRQLKEELIRAKADVRSSDGSRNGYFHVQNVRESLNNLRVSLNRSLLIPNIDDNDTDEEVNVNEEDVKELRQQIDEFYSSCEGNPIDISVSEDCVQYYSVEEGDESEKEEVCLGEEFIKLCHEDSDDNTLYASVNNTSRAIRSSFRDSISVSSSIRSPMLLEEPQLSESPKIRNLQRKSVAFSSSCLGSSNKLAEDNSSSNKDLLGKSFTKDELMRSSLRSSNVFPGPTESLAASLKRGLQIIDSHQRNSLLNKSSTSFSFGRLSCGDSSDQTIQQKKYSIDERTATLLCGYCRKIICDQDSNEVPGSIDTAESGNPDGLTDKAPKGLESIMEKEITREKELENVCKEQAVRIDELNQLVEKLKGEKELNSIVVYGKESSKQAEDAEEYKLPRGTSSDCDLEEKYEIKEVREELTQRSISFDATEKEELLKEIQNLRSKLQLYSDAPVKMSTDKLRSSLMSRSIQLRKSGVFSPNNNGGEELEKERERWTEMESEWICLTDELRVDLEANRQRAERVEQELRLEKMCTEELDDALKRSVLGHARMVEHYVDLQEKYNDLVAKHNAIMHGIAEVKKAAAKAGKRGHARFAKSLAAELSALRVEREREAKFLKKENTSLKIQLRDTAEAVHAAGELLVRLREAEHAASVAEDNFTKVQQDNEKLKKQMDKLKRKHKMELITMKQYLAESKLPESALKQLYREDSDVAQNNTTRHNQDDDQAWRAEFGAIYQEHY